jgi:hypothetical protein
VAPRVRHVVTRIEQPFGTPASARPAVPAPDELAGIFAARLRARIGEARGRERDAREAAAAVRRAGRGRAFGGVKGGARRVAVALEEGEAARMRARALAEELARLEAARGEAAEEAVVDERVERETNPWRRRAWEAARAWEVERQRRARTRSSREPPRKSVDEAVA